MLLSDKTKVVILNTLYRQLSSPDRVTWQLAKAQRREIIESLSIDFGHDAI